MCFTGNALFKQNMRMPNATGCKFFVATRCWCYFLISYIYIYMYIYTNMLALNCNAATSYMHGKLLCFALCFGAFNLGATLCMRAVRPWKHGNTTKKLGCEFVLMN